MPDFVRVMGESDGSGGYVLNSDRQSIITSLLSAGTFFGALGQTLTSDRIGRKGSIIFWSTIFTIGVIIQVSSFGHIQLSIGRLIAGLGVGAMSAIVPLYVGEAAPKKLRGALLVLYQVQIATGIFLSYMVNFGTHHINSSASWRVPIGLQLAWGLFLIFGALGLPESPRLLLGRGQNEKALIAIARLNDAKVDDAVVQEAMIELGDAIKEENEGGKATWFECFSIRGAMWKRTMNGMVVQMLQQLNGQNFYYYYGPVFFERAGVDLDSYSIQAILGGVSLAMVIPAMWTIEHVGRRKSLLFGAALQACFAVVAAFVGHYFTDNTNASPSDQTTGGNVQIAMAILHVSAYSMFWGPTPWVLLGETFPLRVRPKCIALGSASNWFWNFMLSYFSPFIVDDIGSYILLIFFGCLVFAIIFVFIFVPETKGISLEEVDEMYRSGVPAWRSSSWTPSGHKRGALESYEKGEKLHGRRASDSTAVDGVVDSSKKAETGRVAHHEEDTGRV